MWVCNKPLSMGVCVYVLLLMREHDCMIVFFHDSDERKHKFTMDTFILKC